MEANTIHPDQTAPKGISLILVHIVCNIGFLRTYADKRADDKSCDWREKGLHAFTATAWARGLIFGLSLQLHICTVLSKPLLLMH